jgi:Putative peptidoglycan binding domain
MERRQERDPGYDDWFDEPEPLTETTSATRGGYDDSEDWVLPEDEATPSHSRGEIVIGGRTLTTTQLAIIALSLLALIFAILAAAGVFSSGNTAPPVTTSPPPATVTVSTPATTAASATPAPEQPLSPGATGEQVKVLQRALASLGYSPGKVDGTYGPSTQSAVEQFQAANGLAADGTVGPQTLAALQQALSG